MLLLILHRLSKEEVSQHSHRLMQLLYCALLKERKEKKKGTQVIWNFSDCNKYLYWGWRCNMFGILQRSRLLQFKQCVNHLLPLSSGSPTDFGNWLQGFFVPLMKQRSKQSACWIIDQRLNLLPPPLPNDRISRLCPAVFVSDSLIFTAQFLTATDQVCNVTKYFFGGICVSLLQNSTTAAIKCWQLVSANHM